ncbi:unnamed protein product, partial [Hymenolepis diminuta]
MLVSGRARERIGDPTAEIASNVEISESTGGPSASKRARLDNKSSNSGDNRQSSTEGTDKSTLRASDIKSGDFVTPIGIKNNNRQNLITESRDDSTPQKSPLKCEDLLIPVGIKVNTKQQIETEGTDNSTVESFLAKKEEFAT